MSSDLVKRLREDHQSCVRASLSGCADCGLHQTVLDEAADRIEALEGEVAALKEKYQYADLASAAMAAIRHACKEIMGENIAFIDDDFAVCLMTQKQRAEAAEARAERLRVALQAIAEKAGKFEGQGGYTAYVILAGEIEAMADAAIRAAAGEEGK